MKDLIIQLFHAYFNHELLDNSLLNNRDFLMLLKEQSLLPYLHYVFDNKKVNNFYYASLVHQEMLNDMQQNITNLFNNNKIKHFYFKGSVLNYLYDDNALRTRGDIDVYIDISDMEKAKHLLKDYGFTLDENICMHHLEMRKDNILVELHYSLFDPTDFEYNKFFKEPFKMAHLINDYYYELNYEEHFIFCMCHFARHLRTGAGIRYILDFYYMNKKWQIDYDKLHKMLQELNLMTLYQNILNAIYVLTNEKQDIYESKDIDFFIEYLLENGIHGLKEKENFDKKLYGNRKNKFSHILKTAFVVDKNYRLALYPHLGKHLIFYPLCLIHRIFYLLFHKTGILFKYLFTKRAPKKEKEDFYNKLGI